ncbi:MAG: pirin-like C-terminal cupin domain-containing protein [Chloroflexota bacterium]
MLSKQIEIQRLVEAVFAYQIPLGWNGLIYVLEGRVAVVDAVVDRGDAGIVEGGRQVQVTSTEASRFALMAGEPHGEPIRRRGSFVL